MLKSSKFGASIAALSLIASLTASLDAFQGRGRRNAINTEVSASVILGRPTDSSIAVSVLIPRDADVFVEYGTASGDYKRKTDAMATTARVPLHIDITGLTPNTRFFYRLQQREKGQRDFAPTAEQSFMTARAAGSTFSFGVQGDSHPERDQRMYDAELYRRTMDRVKSEHPDLYFMLGDDFSIERLIASNTTSQETVNQVYADQRPFLTRVAASTSLFLVNGNHEEAARFLLNGTPNSPAVFAGKARTAYYPLPAPDAFYSGDAEPVEHIGLLRDYYAMTWGDALFVAIDPYWHSTIQVDADPGGGGGGRNGGGGGGRNGGGGGGGRNGGGQRGGGQGGGQGGNAMNAAGLNRNQWSITLGDAQYAWLKKTLESSNAKYKFVFAHHVMGTGRGAVEVADGYEWGGKDPRGQVTFKEKRPTWDLPIHQLMVKTGVTIFFQGHDHLFARQEKDGVIYQEVPNPADLTYTAFNKDAYRSGDILPNAGHLLVTVSPDSARVDYVRSFLPKDENTSQKDGAVAFSYTVKPRNTSRTASPTKAAISASASGAGSVVDDATGLMWQREDGGEMTWEKAKVYADELVLDGHDDWRLPTARELFTIFDHTRNPALDPARFPRPTAEYWWSSQPLAGDSSRVWVTNSGGGVGPHPAREDISAGGQKRFHVRCVRDVRPHATEPSPRFKTNTTRTTSDLVTGLMWQQDEGPADMTWDDAARYAEGLTLGGYGDWRLPTIIELQSLHDVSRTNPSINISAFPGAQPAEYWSSTTLQNRNRDQAWVIDFRLGIGTYAAKSALRRVRCVRSAATTLTPVPTARAARTPTRVERGRS